MCQRYVLPDQVAAEREFLPERVWWQFTPRYNVAPAQYVPAIRVHDRQSEGVMLRWGFIPSWFEGEPAGTPRATVAHARLDQSPSFRMPWLASQRCILPATGFYTWQLTADRYRQPHFVQLARRSIFGMAAVWDRWVSADDDVIESCAVITLPANERVAAVSAPDAGMPVILRRKDYGTWLHGNPAAAKGVLLPYDGRWMLAHPVSPRINSTAVDDPALIRIAG